MNNIYHLKDDYAKKNDLEDVMSDYPTEDELEKMRKMAEMEEIKQNIDRMIIQESLLNFEITDVDLKAVENATPQIN